jgi:hypothetical protein
VTLHDKLFENAASSKYLGKSANKSNCSLEEIKSNFYSDDAC